MAHPSQSPGEAALLGREKDLALLEEALGTASSGRGTLCLVSGEAGRGKTALVGELARRAEELGFSVSLGRAWEFADAPPCFPLRACLRSIGVDPRSPEFQQGGGAFLLWESTLEALAATTREAPALWIIEDVHAADVATLDLLVYLAQPLRALRACVVVTARPDDPRLSDPLRDRLTRIARDGLDLRLEPLSPADIVELGQRIAESELTPELVHQLCDLSGGNPLFVVEYARAIRAANGRAGALSMLPTTLRQVVLERARFLPEQTLETLSSAAVTGREFSAAIVGRMLGVSPSQVIDSVLPALKTRLLQETAPGQFRFSHVLVRDALYESNDPNLRARLHRRAAEALSRDDGEDALIARVQHAVSGLPETDSAEALELADRAIAMLEARRAFDRAFALERRVQEARRAGLLPAASPEQMLKAARLAQEAGAFAEAKRIGDAVMARGRSDGDARLMARAALSMGAALNPGVVDSSLVSNLREAHAALGDSDPKLGALVWARLSAALQPAPDPMVPVAMAHQAIAQARAQGDEQLLCEVLFFAGSALVDFAPAAERLQAASELFSIAERTKAHTRALQASVRLAIDYAGVGDFTLFNQAIDDAFRLSGELGHAPRYHWRPLMLTSMRASMLGNFDESERIIVELKELRRQYGEPALEFALLGHELMVRRMWRQDDEVRQMLPRFHEWVGVPEHFPVVAATRASMYARMGDIEACKRDYAIVAPSSEKFERDPDFCNFIAEVAAFVGIPEHCRRLRETLRNSERRECVMGHVAMTYEGPSGRAVGLLDAALGEHEAALAELERALELVVSRGQRPFAAQIEYEVGVVLATIGRHDEARRRFQKALERASELSMTGLVKAARSKLDAAAPSAPLVEAAAAPKPAGQAFALALEGELFRCTFQGRSSLLKDSRGLRLLAELVARPDEEVHVLVLAADDAGSTMVEASAGEHLDERALREYRARLRELETDIDQADLAGDRGQREKLGRERDALVAELSRAVGLGGRSRSAGSATERARVNVQKRLKDAIARLGDVDPDAGQYLQRAVRTGAFCSFRP